jgi:Ner family transcriptional regulator
MREATQALSGSRAAQVKGWHSEDVKAAIRKKGETLTSLSRRNGLCDSYLRVALIRPSRRAESIIANFIGEEPETIWPARYGTTATPKRRRARRSRR